MKFNQKLVLGFGLFFLLYMVSMILVNVFTMRKSYEKVYERELNNITESIYHIAYSAYLTTQQQVNSNLNIAEHFVSGRAYIDSTEKVDFTAENQITHETIDISVPAMYVRNNVGLSEQVSKNRELVNYITGRLGGSVTIFQLIDEGLLRISTSVLKQDSTAAIGTYIPRTSPVFQTIMKGEVYQGRAYVVDDWYVTSYSPVYEGSKIIGAIYVGVKQTELTILNQVLKSFRLGKTYFPFILAGKGEVLVHPFRDGGSIYDLQDLEGKYFIRDIYRQINEDNLYSGTVNYLWPDERDGSRSARIIHYRYLPQMDWVIGVGIEKQSIYQPLRSQINTSVIVAVILFLIIFWFIILLGRAFTRQVDLLDEGMNKFTARNFDVKVPVTSSDELGRMTHTFNHMAAELRDLYSELDNKVKDRTRKISEQNLLLKEQKQEIEETNHELLAINQQLNSLNTALSNSEEKYRRLVENLREDYIFYSQTPDGTYSYISPSVKDVLGYETDEAMKGILRFSTSHPVNREAAVKTKMSLTGAKQEPFNIELYDKKGYRKWFEIREIPVFNEDDQLIAVEGIVKDITSYIESRRRIQKEKEYAELILKVIPSAVFTVDKNRKILSWNEKAAEITGYDASDVIGKNCLVFSSGPCEDHCFLFDDRVKKPLNNKECIIVTKDGQKKTILKNSDLLRDENGNITGGIESFEDITQITEAERQLRELNATKDKFFSIIAHDLKNPFNALLAFTDYLVASYDEITSEEMQEYLQSMHESTSKGYKLLDNLLQWSRVQTGRITMAPEMLNLREVAAEAIEPVEISARTKKISIKNQIPSAIQGYGDKNMVITIFRNLISNAIKYSYKDSVVEAGAEESENEVVLFVKDYGTGISKENQKELFRIDSEFSSPGTNEESGTGLGLILSRDFVREMGGRIWFESKEGEGSTFFFSLRLAVES